MVFDRVVFTSPATICHSTTIHDYMGIVGIFLHFYARTRYLLAPRSELGLVSKEGAPDPSRGQG